MTDRAAYLKPCPHCGGEPREALPDSFGYVIACRACGASIFGATRDIAASRWNRRVSAKDSND